MSWKKRLLFYFFKDFIYLPLDRGEGRETERERNIDGLPLLHVPSWGPSLQPRHDRESNLWTFGPQDDAQPTESQLSGQKRKRLHFKSIFSYWLLERERKETLICLFVPLIYAFILCALTWDQTCNLGLLGRCSNQTSYQARAYTFLLYKNLTSFCIPG